MGNFTLIAKSNLPAQKQIAHYYRSQIGKEPKLLDAGEFLLVYCDKGFLNESHLTENENGFICFSGAPVFCGSASISEAVGKVFQQLNEGAFNAQHIRGNYCFVYFNRDKGLMIGHDAIKAANLFANRSFSVISNSFISTVMAVSEEMEYNKDALAELCLLGHITGNETIFTNIFKIHHDTQFKNIPFTWATSALKGRPVNPLPDKEKEVQRQLNILETYFSDTAPFLNRYGANLGTSDGHDSRLLAGFFKRKITKSSFYTFWRKKETPEIRIAKQVATQCDQPLRMIEGKDISEKSEAELVENFLDSFYLFDGQPRLHSYFFDDFNTVTFLRKLINENLVSVSGVGGEAYRNNRHFLFRKIRPKVFFRKHIIEDLIPGILQGKQLEKLLTYLQKKFDNELVAAGIHHEDGYYNKMQVHFFLNEYQNNAYRLNRANGENQYVMQVAPYLDPKVLFGSYHSLPYHGISYGFQQEMLRKNDPALADIISGYGYTFKKGEPLKNKIRYLLKSMLPSRIVAGRKQHKLQDESGLKLLKKFPFLNVYFEKVKSLNLEINIHRLFLHPERWPVMISLGFALCEFEKMKNQHISKNER